MPSVMLNKGRYWVGRPDILIPDWEPSPSCTYRLGPYTYHAFYYSVTDTYVAAIPEDAIDKSVFKDKKQAKTFVNFDKPTVFYEQEGKGHIGNIEL